MRGSCWQEGETQVFFIYLIRFLCGYVRFRAKGGFPERFINLCSKENIPLWDISGGKGEMYAKTTIRGYHRIRPCARKSGMRPRVAGRYGLPFFLHRHRRRIGLLCGAAVAVLIVCILSSMIWTIDVQGNETVSDTEILSVFEELGVHVGARRSKIDVEEVQRTAARKLNDLAWLALNIKGSAAVIEVRERIPAPKVENDTTPRNILAARDGTILSLEVYEGEAAVKKGQAVLKGDLLISSVVTNKDLSVSFKHARGVAVAQTHHTVSHTFSYRQRVRRYTGEQSERYRLSFFGLQIPFGFDKQPQGEVESFLFRNTLHMNHVPLPIYTETYLKRGYTEQEVTLTKEQALQAAAAEFEQKVGQELKDAKILEQKVEVRFTQEGCVVTGQYTCEEEIGIPEVLQVEDHMPLE